MPLEMTKSLCEEVIRHARAEHPNEMCGLLVAPLGYDFPMRWILLQNASVYSSRFYEFDVQEFMAVSAELDRRNEDIVALVHSHTATEAYPSGVDAGGALPMGWRYVIVSTARPVAEIRAFRIEQGRVTEEEVREVSCDQLQRAQPDGLAGT